jgi:hypothetical protein
MDNGFFNRPSHYFGEVFFDTSGPTHEAILACVAKIFGAEQIVFGTDHPFGLGRKAGNMSNMPSA